MLKAINISYKYGHTVTKKGCPFSTTRFIQTSANCKTFMTHGDGAGMGTTAELAEKM